LNKINSGGLELLYEFVIDTSGKELMEILKLASDDNNYPLALYCTAGDYRLIIFMTLKILQ
jgi:hypothetical protein